MGKLVWLQLLMENAAGGKKAWNPEGDQKAIAPLADENVTPEWNITLSAGRQEVLLQTL